MGKPLAFSAAAEKRRRDLLERGTADHYQDATLYDFEYADRTEDIEWYRAIARDHAIDGELVELGAGSGRVCVPLAADGHRVVAIDRMPPMLAALARRIAGTDLANRIHQTEADMRDIPRPDSSAPLVIAPFNGLMHLYSWSDLMRCFAEVHRVLRPGGAFAFDVLLPDLEWLTWDPDKRHAVTRFVHPATRERLVYSTNHRYDPSTQICHIRIFYDDAPPKGRKFKPPAHPKKLVHLAHRQIFPEELRALLDAAGLRVVSHDGDFSGQPLRRGSDSQVVLCERPR